MDRVDNRNGRVFEVMLVLLVLGMTALFGAFGAYRMVTLNLFYLPIILSAYFLGRFSAGVLVLLAALAVTICTLLVPQDGFAGYNSPLLIALALTIWSASMGLAGMLTGTLCDARAATVEELQRAYVGMAEVLARYLEGSDPKANSATARVAELSQQLGEELRLTPKQVDDIRVAALLHDLGNVEITTQVISRVVGSLARDTHAHSRRTFMGTELVQSLGEVLHDALPLLVNQDDRVYNFLTTESPTHTVPIGVHVIRTARAFDCLSFDEHGNRVQSPREAIRMLRADTLEASPQVLDALERLLARSAEPVGKSGAGANGRPDARRAPAMAAASGDDFTSTGRA